MGYHLFAVNKRYDNQIQNSYTPVLQKLHVVQLPSNYQNPLFQHYNWLKGHLCLIEQIGMENYMIEMLGE